MAQMNFSPNIFLYLMAYDPSYYPYTKGMFVKLLLGKRALRRNDKKPVEGAGGEFYYVNGISVAQGPNYGMFQSDYPSLIYMSFSNLSPD